MPSVLLAILAAASALGACGCAPQIRKAPPCAAIEFVSAQGEVTRAQGVWIGPLVLTAAHVLIADDEEPVLVSDFLLNGEPVRILRAESGDLPTVARMYSRPAPRDPSEWLEDWAVVEVSSSAPAPGALRVFDGPVRPGDKLFAVGFPPAEESPRLWAVPLTAVRLIAGGDARKSEGGPRAALERLIAARAATRIDLRGWSGAFVGRYDAGSGDWQYVGNLIGGAEGEEGERGLLILRPPPEALQWLMEEAIPVRARRDRGA